MTERYQRVQPTPFDAPAAAQPSAATPGDARSKWLFPAFAGLGLLALIVIFVLPRWIDSKADTNTAASRPTVAGNSTPSANASNAAPAREAAADPGSPFADARAAKARAEAQELLAELLDVQENLEERGAQGWAEKVMQTIAAQALAGDELYRERSFDAAIEQYQLALAQALALEQSLPQRFEDQIAAARAAIEALDAEAAATTLSLAEQLQPTAPQIAELSARLAVLPQLTSKVLAATNAEAAGDLPTAVSNMQGAADSDPAHQHVQSELVRLTAALTQARFNAAMSEGYAALDDAEFSRAQERFERASSLNPGSSEASAALQELSVTRTAATLQRLQSRGSELLQDEDWAAAITTFEEALAIDKSLRFARAGLAIAKPRGQIATELTTIVEQPQRLVDDAILREAQQSLLKAKALDGLGPRLNAQIIAAEHVLAVASTPVAVTISSDGLTEVTVYKVARLGLFETQALRLRPGQYTAVGSRRGYRDARVVFTVTPEETAQIYVACSEAI